MRKIATGLAAALIIGAVLALLLGPTLGAEATVLPIPAGR
jgi:hypothetical protein